MDLPNSQQLNKVTDDEVASTENCRLQNVLNQDCLTKVLEYVSDADLIEVSKLGIYYKNVIGNGIIGRKLIESFLIDESEICRGSDFRPLYYLGRESIKRRFNNDYEMFNIFGKWIRKCKIYTTDLKFFFETILKCCSPAKLLEVELAVVYIAPAPCNKPYYDHQIDLDLLNQTLPFYSSLRKLTFSSVGRECHNPFLEKISTIASELKTLHLKNIIIAGAWLENMNNLSELTIGVGTVVPLDHLISFLCVNEKLKSFKNISGNNVTNFGDVLSRNCTGLKTFEDIYLNHNAEPSINRYDFLSTFPHLNNVALTSLTYSGCDLYYPIMILAKKNIVKLKFYMKGPTNLTDEENEHVIASPITKFRRLETLEINMGFYETGFDLQQLKFIMYFLSYSTNIQHFTIKSKLKITGLNKILELMPNIQTLSISGVSLFRPPVEIYRIVGVLRKGLIGAKSDKNKYKVVVNNEQWNELRVHKDIKSIMTINRN